MIKIIITIKRLANGDIGALLEAKHDGNSGETEKALAAKAIHALQILEEGAKSTAEATSQNAINLIREGFDKK